MFLRYIDSASLGWVCITNKWVQEEGDMLGGDCVLSPTATGRGFTGRSKIFATFSPAVIACFHSLDMSRV